MTVAVAFAMAIGLASAAHAVVRDGGAAVVGPAPPGTVSDHGSVSSDGRWVAFDSTAALVPSDRNGQADVFVEDLWSGDTRLVSAQLDGAAGEGHSIDPMITPGGRYITFSSAVRLSTSDTNDLVDVYVHDLWTHRSRVVSVTAAGCTCGGSGSAVTPDGRYIAFLSLRAGPAPGRPRVIYDVFVRDMWLGTTRLATVARDGTAANDSSGRPSISADGRYVTFGSAASNLVAGDDGHDPDIFLRDMWAATTRMVNVGPGGAPMADHAWQATVSGDGSRVVFTTSRRLDQARIASRWDLFSYDVRARATRLLTDRIEAAATTSGPPSVSHSGQFVTFAGAPQRGNTTYGSANIYLRDHTCVVNRLLVGGAPRTRRRSPATPRCSTRD